MAMINSRAESGIRTVAVIGAGFMGWQIALQSALHGYEVRLCDLSTGALEAAREQQLQDLLKRGLTEPAAVLDRLTYQTELHEAVTAADLVIEAIPEQLDAKRTLFHNLDNLCSPNVLLATNSSSLRVALLEEGVQHRERLLNMHFFGYIRERPMAELMGGTGTSDSTLIRAKHFISSIGLTPLMVHKQSTGFLFNRVWRAIKKECLQVADQGIASVQDIDRAWMIFNQAPIGPFGLMDMIGLDVIRDIELVYYRESSDPKDAPPRLLLDTIERGDLGVKTGRGFYTYPDPEFTQAEFLRP